MNWKKSLIFCVSFLTFFFCEITINIACGPEQDPYDSYISYFHNNVQGDEFESFAFNDMVYLYDSAEIVDESAVNSAEWANYLKVKKEDVLNVMYQEDSATNVKLSHFSGKSTAALPDRFKRNTYLLALIKKAPVFRYYEFAKSCEPMVEDMSDSWNPVVRDSTLMIKKACDALDSVNVTNDGFLKIRYAYQAARLFHYAGNYIECKIAYKQHIKSSKEKTSVKGWAMALNAGALRYTGNQDEAAYYFSRVFASNPEKRVQAYRNYFYVRSPIEDVLKYAKNNAEKADIWAINGFRDPAPNLERLEKVYQYDPKSLLVGALLVREVNKLEQNLIVGNRIADDYFADYINRYHDMRKKSDSSRNEHLHHLVKVRDFALKLAFEHKYPQYGLGMITAAYLSWVEGQNDLAAGYLRKVNVGQLSPGLYDQYRITELLIKANKIKKGGDLSGDDLVPALKWLDAKRYEEDRQLKLKSDYSPWQSAESRFTKTTRNLYQQVIAPAYLKSGDTTKTALAMLKGDLCVRTVDGSYLIDMSYQTSNFWHQSLSPRSMQNLNNLRLNKKEDNLLGFLSRGLNMLKKDDFYELYGTTYLRTHQYAKALAIFSKISTGYAYVSFNDLKTYGDSTEYYANAFVETMNDYPKTYDEINPRVNKKSFVKKMLRLQKLIVSDKRNAAVYYYKMANAVYQTGHFGNSWGLISYSWNANDLYTQPINRYDDDYKLAKTASIWYLKARSLSKDPNFKSKCTFMLAKCAQKKIISLHGDRVNWYENHRFSQKEFMALNYGNPYFKEMKSSYTKTPFYKIAVNECSYFKDFIHQTN